MCTIKFRYLFVFILLGFLVSCNSNVVKKNITTDYNDELIMKAYMSGNLHETYLTYKLTSVDVQGEAYFYCKNITSMPQNPFEDFKNIINVDGTHVYFLANQYIFVNDKRIDSIPMSFTLESYRNTKEDIGDYIETINCGILALAKTQSLKYLTQFAPIVFDFDKGYIDKIIQKWSIGDISYDEIEKNKNDGYTKEDMMNWAKKLLENE